MLEIDEIWRGVRVAEDAAVPLEQIGLALTYNWTATVLALASGIVDDLRALIAEAEFVERIERGEQRP
jgi:hypothetical protein